MKYTDTNTPPPTEMILEFLAVVLMHGETFTGEQYHMAAVRYAGGYVWFGGGLGFVECAGEGWRVTDKGKEFLMKGGK